MESLKPFKLSRVEIGDCVLLVAGHQDIKAVTICKGEVTQTRFGAFRHNDCIGKLYGSKIQTSRGHLHILAFDPVLWSGSLPHRTQIIYPPDASVIVGGLDLVPGSRVFESGTGSGSLTHFLAQAVWPTGSVHTFEFHTGRAERASEEFSRHSLHPLVTVTHKDICINGFPEIGEPENPEGVDAVVLDVPQPWMVVSTLPKAFRSDSGGRFCSFSPCIEQVQRTCAALREAGFVQVQTCECLQRSFCVSRAALNVPNMGQSFTTVTVDDTKNFPESNAVSCTLMDFGSGDLNHLIKDEEDIENDIGRPSVKKVRRGNGVQSTLALFPHPSGSPFSWEATPQPVVAGHTGYLTFASWLPKSSCSPAVIQRNVKVNVEQIEETAR